MNLSALKGEEELLLRRLEDLARISGQRGIQRFSAFLNGRQIAIAEAFVHQRGIRNAALYGGYDDAERKLCAFLPEGGGQADYPILPVTISFPENSGLSHRDFLGAVLGLGVKRESIGDILVAPGRCIMFLLESVAGVILGELSKVGRDGVKCKEGFEPSLLPERAFSPVKGTVGSARLDSLVKLLTGLSRENSAALVRERKVALNYREELSVSDAFGAGDVVSIRGYGKFTVVAVGQPTRKGRLTVTAWKYI